jgi:fructose-1,6-bisphosphatase/inositol monophosphatase family enzyme
MLTPAEVANLADETGQLLRTIGNREILPRHGRLGAAGIHAKTTQDDPNDLVTVVDHAVEERLRAELKVLLPDAEFLGEEQASADPAALDILQSSRPVWVVDPLDGTKGFASGGLDFGTMLALVESNEVWLSAIYLPVQGELFVAHAGGAFLNKQRIVLNPKARSPRGVLYTRFLPEGDRSKLEQACCKFDMRAASGSAAITYTDIARGKLDFAFYARLLPWDHVPGAFLVGRAGGSVGLQDGERYIPTITFGNLIVAGSQDIWDQFRQSVGNQRQ